MSNKKKHNSKKNKSLKHDEILEQVRSDLINGSGSPEKSISEIDEVNLDNLLDATVFSLAHSKGNTKVLGSMLKKIHFIPDSIRAANPDNFEKLSRYFNESKKQEAIPVEKFVEVTPVEQEVEVTLTGEEEVSVDA